MSNEEKANLRHALLHELRERARQRRENPLPVNDTNGRHDQSRLWAGGNLADVHKVK